MQQFLSIPPEQPLVLLGSEWSRKGWKMDWTTADFPLDEILEILWEKALWIAAILGEFEILESWVKGKFYSILLWERLDALVEKWILTKNPSNADQPLYARSK